jgi:hypothetical protein
MPKEPKRAHQAPLPQNLSDELDRFRRRLWQIKIAESIFAGFFGLLFSYLLVFGLDRLMPTGPWLRLGILLAGTSLFVGFAPYWLRRWVWSHRNESQLARLIARKYPQMGDRLLGVIELQDQTEDAASLSPRLRAAAMESVAREVTEREFEKALPTSHHRRWSLCVLVLFLGATSALIFMPKAGISSLKRWLMPLADTPRYTFTSLEKLPEVMIVPHGETFDLLVKLASDTERRPTSGSARIDGQAPISADLENNTYLFTFPGQVAKTSMSLEIGDARQRISIQPTERPSVGTIAATIAYPDYLQQPARQADLRTGALSTVEGSKVSFHLDLSRSIKSAAMGPARAPKDGFGRVTQQAAADPADPVDPTAPVVPAVPLGPLEPAEQVALNVAGKAISTPPVVIGKRSLELPFAWTDELGLQGESGFNVRVEALEDAAPTAYIQGVDRNKVILAPDTVEFEVLGEDDFGVKEIGIAWEGEFTKATDAVPAKGDMRLTGGAHDARRLNHMASFSPGALGISPQRLKLRAYIEDYLPGRPRVYSEPITLLILTPDEYAQMLKADFDKIIGELEDINRKELSLLDENERLEKLDPEALQNEENKERLQKQEDAEKENTERMKELAKKMEKLLKDAARSEEVEKDAIKKMAETLKTMKELADKDMPEVEKKLDDAQSPKSTPEKAAEDMKEAVEKQKKVAEKMKKAIESANEANKQLEASTFVNRLKKAASEESGIASSLKSAFDKLLGLSFEDLDPADQRAIRDIHALQGQTAADVRWIQEDLGHFYARTNKPIHKELMDKMRESQIDQGLTTTLQLLERNFGYRGTDEAVAWAAKLSEWAKLLDGDKPKKPGGGGGGGGGDGGDQPPPPPEDDDFEFMLQVMQMIQKEQELRARTRALEQLQRSIAPQATPEAIKPKTSGPASLNLIEP